MTTSPRTPTTTERIPVLVAGGSLTGLSTAVFLSWHGVPVTVLERHPDLLAHPRLRALTPRAMETLRQVGLEPAIRQHSYADGDDMGFVPVTAQTLSDPYAPVTEPEDEFDGASASDRPSGAPATYASPCSFGPIDQDRLEAVLRDRARELGATVRFSTELVSFDADADGVTACVRDREAAAEWTVRTDYLVAADGSASTIRQRLEIDTEGPGTLYHTITAMIEADLTAAVRGRPLGIAYLQRPRPFSILMAHGDTGTRWIFGTGRDPQQEPLESFTDERIAEMVRAASGLPDVRVRLHPQIPGTRLKVLSFDIGAQIATRYSSGRVFLVGDAARANPPTGGFGGSTGVQEAHNLAWKLAWVRSGHAGSGLLASYDEERRPVGDMTMRQAYARFGDRMADGAGVALLPHPAVTTGYQYRSRAVCGATGEPGPLMPEQLGGAPGTRAPHLPVERAPGSGAGAGSTLDLYGRSMVLLTGPRGDDWTDAASRASARLGVPVEAYRLGSDLGPPDGPERHGIGAEGAVLVRPDGFVGWRSGQRPTRPAGDEADDRAGELERVLRALLSRGQGRRQGRVQRTG